MLVGIAQRSALPHKTKHTSRLATNHQPRVQSAPRLVGIPNCTSCAFSYVSSVYPIRRGLLILPTMYRSRSKVRLSTMRRAVWIGGLLVTLLGAQTVSALEPCPDGCSGHGHCQAGRCRCDRGFTGPSCSAAEPAACPHACSAHGICNGEGGCLCDEGYAGVDCGRAVSRICPLNCAGHGLCVHGGLCLCRPGFTGEACTEVSLRNSRGCPHNCSGRGICTGGSCICAAGFGGLGCEMVLSSLPDGSGSGGQIDVSVGCPSGCSGHGRCIFEAGRSVFSCRCDAGWDGAACSSLDVRHQGCQTGCSGHGVCVDARCLCDDGFGGADCSEQLARPGCPLGCSGHGECRAGGIDAGPLPGVRPFSPHAAGLCVCDAGMAGEACAVGVSTAPACPAGCSGHGLCRNSGCACEAGFGGEDCGVVCPGRCSGHGSCSEEGTCECEPGYWGDLCQVSSECHNACSGRGECRPSHTSDALTRAAEEAAAHARAALAVALAAHTNVEEVTVSATAAANRAAAAAEAAAEAAAPRCLCAPGWAGAPDCSVRDDTCPVGCSGHGRCVDGACVCDADWHGMHCASSTSAARALALQLAEPWRVSRALPRCPQDCSGHGMCLAGLCYCDEGFDGPTCVVEEESRAAGVERRTE